ncbi:MAG TPA: cation:proton antiporter subunit C [Methanoregulaceae archaeon]|nr:cation:proton antiporter subunit C [Methanoregulaceae archaeon]
MLVFGTIPYLVIVALAVIGLATAALKRNLIKIFLGITIFESAINLFLVSLGYRDSAVAPIFTDAPSTEMVMATPQALTLTSIVIGVATTALLLSFAVLIWKHYGTVDTDKIRRLKE